MEFVEHYRPQASLEAPYRLSVEEQTAVCAALRRSMLEVCVDAESGHIGASSSSAELLTSLYFGDALRYDPANLRHPDRDLVALRGHLGPLRYSLFSLLGEVKQEELSTYRRLGSRLQGHEEHQEMPGVDLSPSGSLGMLLSYGVGAAVTARRSGHDRLSYIFLGDGEEQEGNVSEAARHAATIGLDNLVAIIDKNGKQLSDPVSTCDSADLEMTWRGYGWDVLTPIDGHNLEEIADAYAWARSSREGKPKLIIANTLKGYGLDGAGEHFSGYHTIDVTPKERVREAIVSLDQSLTRQKPALNKALGAISLGASRDAGNTHRQQKTFEPTDISINPSTDTPHNLNKAQGEYFMRLKEFMQDHPDMYDHTYFLTADVTLKSMVDYIGLREVAGTYMNVGIREQHMVSMAHGISLTDPQSRVLVNYLDAFTYRAADQLNALAQGGGNIIMINDAAGVANARNGRSHQTSGQPGALYTMPGVTLLEPGDTADMYSCFNWAIGQSRGPVVIRTHRSVVEPFAVSASDRNLENYVVHDTPKPDLVIAASGLPVGASVDAAKKLSTDGVQARVVNIVNPGKLNNAFMESLADDRPLLSIYNGNPSILSSHIARAIMARRGPRPSSMHEHGFLFGTSGTADELIRHYGFDADSIYDRASKIVG